MWPIGKITWVWRTDEADLAEVRATAILSRQTAVIRRQNSSELAQAPKAIAETLGGLPGTPGRFFAAIPCRRPSSAAVHRLRRACRARVPSQGGPTGLRRLSAPSFEGRPACPPSQGPCRWHHVIKPFDGLDPREAHSEDLMPRPCPDPAHCRPQPDLDRPVPGPLPGHAGLRPWRRGRT